MDTEKNCKKKLNVVKNGKSEYKIVVGETAGLAVKQAAKEIQESIYKATGVSLDIISDVDIKYIPDLKIVSLGDNKVLAESKLVFDFTLLKNDGFFIKTHDNSIFLTGKTDRGTLYSAYEFLERFVGVKFLAYDYTFIPKLDSVFTNETDITENPAFNDRTFLSNKVMTDGKFASEMRMVNEFVNIDEKYGGGLGWFKDLNYISNHVHNTLSYVQPEIYYEEHKDWFYVENGQAVDLDYSHLGITEDGRIDESLSISPVKVAVERLKTFINNSTPDIKYFMIGQQDLHTCCECEDCKAYELKYKRSGMNIRFVNAISDAIDKWMKDEGINREIYLGTFAYQYSQSAPVNEKGEPLDSTVIPRDNVIVRLAPIQANNYYSMTDERQNDRTRNMFLEWSKVAKKTMVWDYHTNYTFYFAYYPTMHVWQENLRLYRKMGCQYILMQSDHSERNDYKANMETYVASKLLWNPELDPFKIRDEYISYYYDGIQDLVKEYIYNFEENYEKKMHGNDVPNNTLQCGKVILHPKYYGKDFLNKQFELIKRMYLRVEKSTVDSERRVFLIKQIDRIKLSALYIQIVGILYYDWKEYYNGDESEKRKIYDSFFTLAEKLGVERTGEAITIEKFKEQCETGIFTQYYDVIKKYCKDNYKKCFRTPQGKLKYPFIVPASSYAYDLWDWDSWLTDVALTEIANGDDIIEYEKGCVLNFLDHADNDGRIPIMISSDPSYSKLFDLTKNVESNIHKPCLAQHALFISRKIKDFSWLKNKFEIFEKFISYYERKCKHPCGLFFWINDFAIGVDNEPCTFYRPDKSTGSIFLNALMFKELSAVAEIADNLGEKEKSEFYLKKANELKAAIQTECWDERDGFFYSVDLNLKPVDKNEWLHSGAPRTWNSLPMRIGVWTGFLALWGGIATEKQAKRMVKEHLLNDKTFNSRYGVRSLSVAEKMYSVKPHGNPSEWLGPIWGNCNYMIFDGLLKYGYLNEARDLAIKTVTLFGKDIESCGEMHEYYDPDTGLGVFNKGFQSWNLLSYNMAEWLRRV